MAIDKFNEHEEFIDLRPHVLKNSKGFLVTFPFYNPEDYIIKIIAHKKTRKLLSRFSWGLFAGLLRFIFNQRSTKVHLFSYPEPAKVITSANICYLEWI